MPELPSIMVTDGQYARLRAVLPGVTDAEKAAAYRAATRDFWRRQVIDAEVRDAQQAADEQVRAAATAAAANADNL